MRRESRIKIASTSPTEAEIRQVLAAGLRTKRREINDAAEAQVKRILAERQISDPEYAEGLRAAISAALDFGLALIEDGDREIPPIPAPLLAQSRLAARNGLDLGTVLRRYFAGYTLFDDFIIQEATSAGISADSLIPVLRTQRRAFDRLLAAVHEEYGRERDARLASSEERLAQRIQRMLDGEFVDTSEIPYDFEGQHLGMVSIGPEARVAIHALARALDRRTLAISKSDGAVWAWLGSGKAQSWTDVEKAICTTWPSDIPVAFGELADGRAGWRLSHRQARAAFPIALRTPNQRARYAEVALEASVSQDDLLVASLSQLYLAPLADRRDGEKIRQTLGAYLDAHRSVTIAATKLEVGRETVTNRVETYEQLVGQSLDACAGAVRAALRLEELGYLRETR
jgi:PucR C-terminal helix-turn-helix domain/GGDEF-like domain